MKYCLAALDEIDERLYGARNVLIATDFDGTLCSIAPSPSEVRIAPATLEVLRHVVRCDRITLAVISGRALSDIRCHLPLPITFAGNHGLEIAGPGFEFKHSSALELRPHLSAACDALTRALRQYPGAWVEDKRFTLTVHFRKVDERRHNEVLFHARRCLSRFAAHVALRCGNKALEVRPRIAWDKGSALNYIREHQGPFDACICIGDDRTDETMFRANPGQFNVRVGLQRPTVADYQVFEPGEVAILLEHVLDFCAFRRQTVVVGQAVA